MELQPMPEKGANFCTNGYAGPCLALREPPVLCCEPQARGTGCPKHMGTERQPQVSLAGKINTR